MQDLNFNHNPLGDEAARKFVNLFLDFETKVVELRLSSVDGQIKFAMALAQVISDGNLPNLVVCDISRNSIGRQGCERLMEGER